MTLHRVQRFTGGNPRLLELYAALRQTGEEAGDALRLSNDPSAKPLFSRLRRRLDDEERDLLSALAVFRSNTPRDAWTSAASALNDLIGRGFIKSDLAGGVALLPFFRELVFNALSPEHRVRLHHNAAHIRAQRGDYTAAAHHYVEAGEPESAVEIWYAHQDSEIMVGQAAAADDVFRQIQPDRLDNSRRTELLVIRNRLALLAGESERVLEGMEGFSWDADDETTAEVLSQWATAYRLLERPDQALDKYDQAIEMLSRMATKIAGWRMQRGIILTQTDSQAARYEAQLAIYDVERLQGMIDYLGGNFDSAQTHFMASLEIARAADDKDRIARAYHYLMLVAGRQGDIDNALAYSEKAMAHYAAIGDLPQLEGVRAELAGTYLNVRQFEAVIEPSEKALQFFERIKHEQWIASISSNLAEAYMETGRLEEARAAAFRVLRLEIARSRPYALYTLGHIHEREGNPTHASASFSEGIEVARAVGDPFIEAYLERVFGGLCMRNGRPADGLAHLEAAARLFTEMGLQHEVTETEAALQAARPA
jgi:tetratricopeptide (TPR) repeat protein